MIFQKYKKYFLIGWFFSLGILLGFFLSSPEYFTAEALSEFFLKFNSYMLFVYFLVSFFRGLTLLPSTPFILAGVFLFPNNLHLVFLISLSGILFSSSLIYFFSHIFGFDAYFEKKFPKKILYLKKILNSPKGFSFVALWSFFPAVPTDLICYIAGTIQMKYSHFITALFLGEIILCGIYIYGGNKIFQFLI